MLTITDRVNSDDRLDAVSLTDDEVHPFLNAEVAPVLATPAIAGGVALVTLGAAYGEAID